VVAVTHTAAWTLQTIVEGRTNALGETNGAPPDECQV
jgi:hypothetical protein